VRTFRAVGTEQAQERLRAGSRWHQTGFAFVTEIGEPCEPRNALRAFKVAAKRAGLPNSVGLHTLRHSAAPIMMASGVPLKIVSDILGHASVAITGDIYGHVSPRCITRGSGQTRGRIERLGERGQWRSLMAVRPNFEAFQDHGGSISWP
jgi:site-specific recombinase XerD